MQKNLNPLYENVENKEFNLNKKPSKWARRLGIGAGFIAGNFAPTAAAAPAMSNMAGYDDNVSNLDYLNGVKVKGQDLQDYLKDNGIEVTNNPGTGPYYNPHTNVINMGLNEKGAARSGKSIFAHELGHSMSMGRAGVSSTIYQTSKTCGSLAIWAQLINCFNNDDESRKKVGRAINVAGGVASLPMVIEEINASMVGSQALGLEGMDQAKAFMGVGSYIALALSPTIMYCVSETTRKFIKALRKIKKEDPQVEQKINNLKKQNIKVDMKK